MKQNQKQKKRLCGIAVSVLAVCLLSGCSNQIKDGTTALEEERYDDAITIFEQVAETEKDKKAAMAYRGIGMANYELKEYEDALLAFRSALDRGAKQTPEMYNLMGICAMKTEDYASALEYIRSGIALCQRSDQEKGKEEDASASELLREMMYNEVVCCEQLADWATARERAAAYLDAYPDDEEMKKEAEFLETR